MTFINNKKHNLLVHYGGILIQLLYNNSLFIYEAEDISLTVIILHRWILKIKLFIKIAVFLFHCYILKMVLYGYYKKTHVHVHITSLHPLCQCTNCCLTIKCNSVHCLALCI